MYFFNRYFSKEVQLDVIESEVDSWWLRLSGAVVKENGTLQNELRLQALQKII